MLCSIGIIAKHYGVSPSTIRRWAQRGLIKVACRTFGGHRRFEVPTVSTENPARKHIGYARVSSHDQKNDLLRQSNRLREAGCEEVIEDIGSGLNCSKPGLRSLMRQLLDGRIGKLTVVHEDRLLRFGVDLIRQVCRKVLTDIEVLEVPPEKTFEEELARDVITLMTVFCARLYDRRSHRNRACRGSESSNDTDIATLRQNGLLTSSGRNGPCCSKPIATSTNCA